MTDTMFPIRSTDHVPMIGRQALLDSIWGKLTKASPDNLSIVGPKDIGKTVLLNALVERAKQDDSPYSLVIYWQLGYAPPQSDHEFIQQLSDLLFAAMGTDTNTYAEARSEIEKGRESDAGVSFMLLREIMEDIQNYLEKSVLMIWDGFDKPLSQALLTGQLFGNLRDLFYGKRHRVVTATRKTQTELARNKQVEDSPFWNMFDVNPVRVGPFDENDIEHALSSALLTINQGGRKELANWTGGHPVLLLSLLNTLMASGDSELTNEHVNVAAGKVASELSDFLDKLWTECTASAKNAFQLIVENDSLDKDRIGKEETRYLLARGFAVRDGAKIKSSCRLFEQHVRGAKPDTGTLDRLFGSWEAYQNEIRTLLELRMKQIRIINARLHKLVSQCLGDIPDYPDDCLNNLTRIEELALDLIWQHEFDGAQAIPNDLVAYWTQHPRDSDKVIKKRMEDNDWDLPRDRLKQLVILQRLTGSAPDFEAKAKSVSKDTYVLLNAIHQFRNRTEHADGQHIHVGVAVSGVLLCIELLSCLERELGGTAGQITTGGTT
ncbi:MAG: hypothetical protein DWQ35_15935 [Planctomycetota bacterium]|nr:MAG: hypothetical protein DWQ35_15935 [Planctomycetota bacterium]REK18278.1 MAG: hypothetical protein DWQ42_20580 [Planctomycetota bacterium]REK49148.1 MAG: hypothetical protein DWQ46_01180 [Planctomycetota bacterium]